MANSFLENKTKPLELSGGDCLLSGVFGGGYSFRKRDKRERASQGNCSACDGPDMVFSCCSECRDVNMEAKDLIRSSSF